MLSWDSSFSIISKKLRHPVHDEQNGIMPTPVVTRPIKTHIELLQFVRALKAYGDRTRKDIKQLADIGSAEGICINVDAALDLTVKILFMISCRSSVNMITTGHIFRPIWKESESLEAFFERVLPRHEIEPVEKIETIKARKLRASYIKEYATVNIEWTNNLPDHLFLQITDDWKSLQVFGLLDSWRWSREHWLAMTRASRLRKA